jgi:uncharacterized RDD family membrane protein YckC
MKCPKCQYLGFETGDRCRNCGYDFSLLTAPEPDGDLPLHEPAAADAGPNAWLDQLRHDPGIARTASPAARAADPLAPLSLDTIAVAAPAAPAGAPPAAEAAPRVARRAAAPALPLFQPTAEDDDQPLIKLPASPRAPLAVRRTPETPKLRTVAKTARPVERSPALQFADDRARLEEAARTDERARRDIAAGRAVRDRSPQRGVARDAAALRTPAVCGPARRLLAAAIDHTILLGIDAVVIYFTLKMAGLAPEQWTVLPVVPLAAFLGMIKAAYFCAFTLVGGQTIGKMAARIRVVADDAAALDPARAVQRTFAGAVSLLTLGLGYAPIVLSADRRALHDRLARTRVVAE